jgi:hypothetical protein
LGLLASVRQISFIILSYIAEKRASGGLGGGLSADLIFFLYIWCSSEHNWKFLFDLKLKLSASFMFCAMLDGAACLACFLLNDFFDYLFEYEYV